MFVSLDGPSGAGKSTIVRHLAQMLVAAGEDVHVTAEPSNGPIGQLCRELAETVTGHALACLYAADRYHHVETEIRPLLTAGKTVISDRYVPSGLVMQRFDGVNPAFLWQLNAEAKRPDLAVILEAGGKAIWGELVILSYDLMPSGMPQRQSPRLVPHQQADDMPDIATLERVLEGLQL
jgi:dTMP kinase